LVLGIMTRELSMLAAPALSILFLLLGALGLLDEGFAVQLALWTGVAQLVGWGGEVGLRSGRSTELVVTPPLPVMPAPADRAAHRSHEPQDGPDDQQDDPKGPQDRDLGDQPDEEQDQTENDHVYLL
jgi:hypothetical protein